LGQSRKSSNHGNPTVDDKKRMDEATNFYCNLSAQCIAPHNPAFLNSSKKIINARMVFKHFKPLAPKEDRKISYAA
jgi:hypothetical protein